MIKPYYKDDNCTIYNCDCEEILPDLPKVDLVLTDPPYGIGYDKLANASGGNVGKAAIKTAHPKTNWDSKTIKYGLLWELLCLGKNSICWGGNYYPLPPSRCWLFWDKENDGKTFADGELAWTNFNCSLRRIKYLWDGMLQKNMGVSKEQHLHPTMKPLFVIVWCIKHAEKQSNINTILDPFMGSGTTLRAAKDLNRKAIGIEREEKYCEIAAQRLQQEVLNLGI